MISLLSSKKRIRVPMGLSGLQPKQLYPGVCVQGLIIRFMIAIYTALLQAVIQGCFERLFVQMLTDEHQFLHSIPIVFIPVFA